MSQDLEDWEPITAEWARNVEQIECVYFVGSQVRPEKATHSESDLDVAIVLIEPHGYGDWVYESETWEADLQERLSIKVHLLRGGGTIPNKKVEAAIQDHGKLVFRRS